MQINYGFEPTPSFARQLDRHDSLRAFRERFHIPLQSNGDPYIYFCGNSLGLQPKTTKAYVEAELEDWARLGVEGHLHARSPWMPYHEFLTEPLARITGALPAEVVAMNALTVNLHLLMAGFYRPEGARHKILIESDAFPSDRYAVASQLRMKGYDPETALLTVSPRSGEHTLRTEDIEQVLEAQGAEIALVLLGGVNYYTGQAFEMGRIAAAAHSQGCMVGYDLAHAVGNIPLYLHEWGADFAAWCSYKYLNGGPGAVGGVFIHEKHLSDPDRMGLAGWWGHNKATRFQMPPEFDPIPTAEGWQMSNAPVLSMAALRASLAIFDEAGMEALRQKSEIMSAYFLWLIAQHSERLGIRVLTPADPAARGCQISLLAGPGGRRLFESLTREGVICDWREPNVIRVAPTPLYNTYEEIWRFVQVLAAQTR
ncbi:MAG: kynureninase [Bacteroidetes bacterium]|nr:MAG: kynureninase [Bacteroidota bacterium]